MASICHCRQGSVSGVCGHRLQRLNARPGSRLESCDARTRDILEAIADHRNMFHSIAGNHTRDLHSLYESIARQIADSGDVGRLEVLRAITHMEEQNRAEHAATLEKILQIQSQVVKAYATLEDLSREIKGLRTFLVSIDKTTSSKTDDEVLPRPVEDGPRLAEDSNMLELFNPEHSSTEVFPGPIQNDSSRPLVEDFEMRGLLYAEKNFPASWLKDSNVEEDEKYFELPSMTSQRKERILWLGRRLARSGQWLTWSESARTFDMMQTFSSGMEDTNSEGVLTVTKQQKVEGPGETLPPVPIEAGVQDIEIVSDSEQT